MWLATAATALLGIGFVNDHFDRLTRARQILACGDQPFADFRDPGYLLTLYASAAAQALTGGSLFGDALLTSTSIATAGALAFWLASSASGSMAVGATATLVFWYIQPRYYDFDKALFYTAGLWYCWRYLDAPTNRRLVAAGLLTAIAGLAPALLFVRMTAGLPEAARQIEEYATREGQRSELFALPSLSFDQTARVGAAVPVAAIVGASIVGA